MSKYKAYEDYSNRTPQELEEDLNKAGDGQASDPIFIDSPMTKVQLDALADNLIESHKNKNGTPLQKEQYKTDHAAAIDAMSQMARYGNFKCAGVAAMYAKLGIRYDFVAWIKILTFVG